jgi:hypothetical protein
MNEYYLIGRKDLMMSFKCIREVFLNGQKGYFPNSIKLNCKLAPIGISNQKIFFLIFKILNKNHTCPEPHGVITV